MDVVDPAVLIEQGCSISELRKHFPTKEQALSYYTQTMTDHYPQADGDLCCDCNTAASLTAVYTWRAFYDSRLSPKAVDLLLLALGHFHLRTGAKVMRFKTHHAFCPGCWRSLFIKRCVANVLHFLSLFVGLISVWIAAVYMATLVYFRDDPAWRKDQGEIMLTGMGAMLILAACVIAFFVANRLRVPGTLRGIPRFPFRYESAQRQKTKP